MKGFKDSTKVQYMKGGSCDGYAKGGDVGVKGAAKIAKVMGEFKRGELHSGSKKGPDVTSRKQATAIALSEARKAGLKIPKKAHGGLMDEGISSRPKDKSGRPISDEMLNTPERILRKSGQADPYEKMPRDMPKPKPRSVTTERVTVSEDIDSSPLSRRLSRPVPKAEMEAARKAAGKGSFRNVPLVGAAMDALGLKKGGPAVMPRGKKGC